MMRVQSCRTRRCSSLYMANSPCVGLLEGSWWLFIILYHSNVKKCIFTCFSCNEARSMKSSLYGEHLLGSFSGRSNSNTKWQTCRTINMARHWPFFRFSSSILSDWSSLTAAMMYPTRTTLAMTAARPPA